jgi:hypothetical protein
MDSGRECLHLVEAHNITNASSGVMQKVGKSSFLLAQLLGKSDLIVSHNRKTRKNWRSLPLLKLMQDSLNYGGFSLIKEINKINIGSTCK